MMVNHQNKGLLIAKVVLAALLIAWLAHSLVQLIDIIQPPSENLAQKTTSKPLDPIAETEASFDIEALKSIALFGEVVDSPEPLEAPPEKKEEPVVETKLNLTLKGLFTSGDSEVGHAIIANGRKDQLYRVNEEIDGLSNVKLQAVYGDRVTLDNRGKAEVLYLYPEGERLAPPQSSPSSPAVSDVLVGDSGVDSKVKPKRLNEIMRVVRERDKSTGDMLGFRVSPGRDREGFEKSGLQVNDVITAIDGDKLTDLRTAMSIYRNKREATQVSLLIRRDGSEISLDIDLAELNI